MSHTQLLLQRPSLWTSEHLDAARVEVIEDATATDLVGAHAPADGDEEFERVWRIWDVATESFNTQNRFKYSREYLRSRDAQRSPGAFFSALTELIDFLCDETVAGTEMTYFLDRCIGFEIPRLCWLGISYQNFLVRHGRDKSIPLAIISIIHQNPGSTGKEIIARHEVPHCLLQGVLAYTREPSLGAYTGITITLDSGTGLLRVSRAALSPPYLARLCAGDPISEDEGMLLYRSSAFEIRGAESREMMRILVGVFRFLGYGQQARISGTGVY